jgi:hypothetical protein
MDLCDVDLSGPGLLPSSRQFELKVPSLAQSVLDGGVTADQAFELIDYALARILK